jgi:hypothetical protein
LTRCEICGKDFDDMLQHLVIVHDIENLEHFEEEIGKTHSRELTKQEFAAYVKDLHAQRASGVISAEMYRELIMKWSNDHRVDLGGG